jgi:DNA-binding NarL/FixJ family response regulator
MNRITERTSQSFPISVMMANMPGMLCELLSGAFDAVPDIHVLEPLNDLQQLLDHSQTASADVLLVGSSHSEHPGGAVGVLEALPDRHRGAKPIVLSQDPYHAEAIALFRAGARGIFGNTELRFDLLCKSIRCVHQGQIWANNALLGHLVSSLTHPRSRDVTDSQGRPLLTTREQEVLNLLADGLSNHELANALKLSEHTIKNHLFRIYDKLGVSNRMEAVLYALTPRQSLPVQTPAVVPMAASSKIRMIKTG